MTDSATQLTPGQFCWVDVACSDPTRIHKFFSHLFGWGRRVRPTDDADAYSIMTSNGEHSAGICGVEDAGPSQWMCYLLVDDLTQATTKAEKLGGKALKKDVKINSFGTMTVMEDPAGAVFALWQSERGEKIKPRQHGQVSWHELLTQDTKKSASFYSQMFDWTVEETTYEDQPYFLFHKDGNEVASMRRSEHKTWVVYFAVDDCEEVAELCRDAGGEVCRAPHPVNDLGHCTMLKDPSGGLFGAFSYES